MVVCVLYHQIQPRNLKVVVSVLYHQIQPGNLKVVVCVLYHQIQPRCLKVVVSVESSVGTDLMFVQRTEVVVPEENTQLVFFHRGLELIQAVIR